MTINLSDKLNKGISPRQFLDSMTKNREALEGWMNRFSWQDEADRQFFRSLSGRDDLRCFVLAAEWCGDVVRNLPVVLKALEESGIPIEILIMEEHTDVMDQFLTMGGRAIPVVIFTDTGGHVLGKWGPRPAYVQEPMTQFKKANPDRSAPDYEEKLQAARAQIRERYGEGTEYQQLIVRELRDLLSGV